MRTVEVNLNNIDDAKEFCEIATKQSFNIDLISGRYVIDGKSILGIFSLDLSHNITVSINSNDSAKVDKFIEEIKQYIVK